MSAAYGAVQPAENLLSGGKKLSVGSDSNVFTVEVVAIQVVVVAYMLVTKMDYSPNTAMETPNYVMFIDVSIMIFFGFGFLMTFLKRSGLTAVGMCVIVSAIVTEFSIVVEDIVKGMLGDATQGQVSLFSLINGLFCAGAVMISMGAVLGKVSPSQLLTMGLMETLFYWVSFVVYTEKVAAVDAAGGIVLHTFGAYFGLTVAKLLTNKDNLESSSNDTIYSSDLFSLAGTLFLWLLWPSFCAAIAPSSAESFYAVCNTYFALIGSVMGFAIVTRILHGGKFDAAECQNATLAGGVAVGVPAIVKMGPAGALIVGILAGVLSTFGYAKVDLGAIAGLSDTCGVNNLHGMPGLLSGVVGLFFYPVGAQLIGLVCTLVIAIVGGLITGSVMKALPSLGPREYYEDNAVWGVSSDY